MSLLSPLARVRGHGSAKDGVEHWWLQRLSAIALVPLTLWFAASLVALTGAGYQEVRAWLSAPVPAVLMVLLLATMFYHLKLGLQVVIEDYVPVAWHKFTLLIAVSFACIVLAAASIFAVLTISLGAGGG